MTDSGLENAGVDGFCFSCVNAVALKKLVGILHPLIDLAKSESVPNC